MFWLRNKKIIFLLRTVPGQTPRVRHFGSSDIRKYVGLQSFSLFIICITWRSILQKWVSGTLFRISIADSGCVSLQECRTYCFKIISTGNFNFLCLFLYKTLNIKV